MNALLASVFRLLFPLLLRVIDFVRAIVAPSPIPIPQTTSFTTKPAVPESSVDDESNASEASASQANSNEESKSASKLNKKKSANGKASKDSKDDSKVVRVYADGIYDLFHFGHARSLEQAKKCIPNAQLIVGVCSDEDTFKYKGRTVMTMAERAECVRHCKWVDEVVENAPWVIDAEFLEQHSIDFVAHDAEPYKDVSGSALESNDVYAFVKKMGKFKATKRTEGVSTTDLINRIIRDRDEYIHRNLKRGMSNHEMNVGFFKAKKIYVHDKILGVRKSLAKCLTSAEKFLENILNQIEENQEKAH